MEKRFYTLLYIDKNEIRSLSKTGIGRATNLSFKDRLKMFLGCAALLNKTLQINKVGNLEILTNDIQLLDKLQSDFGYTIKATEIEFSLDVPQGIKFYSAHFKIDVFKYLGTLSNQQISFLLDNDVICTNQIPQVIENIEQANYLKGKHFPALIYEMPLYGGERMVSDKKKIDKEQIHGLWAGGEFIAGTSDFYLNLYNEIMTIKDKYWSVCQELFHQGDEMLTSVALENIFYKCKYPLLNAGDLGLIKRYWSILDSNPYYQNKTWFAHLPYDKGMLSLIDVNKINSNEDLVKIYKSYWRKLRLKRFIRNIYFKVCKKK